MKLIDLRTNGNARSNPRMIVTQGGVAGYWASFTGALLCLGLVGLVCGFLVIGHASPIPIKAGWKAVMSQMGATVRRPQNQVQADGRTLIAAIRYLLEPEPEFPIERCPTYCGWEPLLVDTQAVTATAMLASNTSRL